MMDQTVVLADDHMTVSVGGGALWQHVDAVTAPHWLYVPAGLISHTGVAGLTLGGGIGWLSRSQGLTCDHLVEAQVVTASGAVVVASNTENPELLWALRGGGAGIGVVSKFVFRLCPVLPGTDTGASHTPIDTPSHPSSRPSLSRMQCRCLKLHSPSSAPRRYSACTPTSA
jgi:FAD/FMN-containing dehydrogenase